MLLAHARANAPSLPIPGCCDRRGLQHPLCQSVPALCPSAVLLCAPLCSFVILALFSFFDFYSPTDRRCAPLCSLCAPCVLPLCSLVLPCAPLCSLCAPLCSLCAPFVLPCAPLCSLVLPCAPWPGCRWPYFQRGLQHCHAAMSCVAARSSNPPSPAHTRYQPTLAPCCVLN